MKSLLAILVVCTYCSIDAMLAPRMVMKSFRTPVVPVSLRSAQITQRSQYQEASAQKSSVDEIKALTDRIKGLENKVQELDARYNVLNAIEKPDKNVKDVAATIVKVPLMMGVGFPVMAVGTCMLFSASLSVIDALFN